ncbi:RNA polymerase sigma factor [Streptomyces litmocidini]|uniref:RNA polymerase sigma factor n=1 Tax=Streptomyces litmocidini TaxID=67318 RepID=UPI0036F7D1E5
MPYALPLTPAPPRWSRLLARVSRAARDRHAPARERRLRVVGTPYGGDGPPPTLTDLYAARRLDMVRLAVFLVDDLPTAEDVVQDAFAAVCRAYGTSLDGLQDPGAYLHTAVVNAARSVLRRRRTARAYAPPHPGSGAPVDEGLLLAEEHRHVLDALAELTRRQREVLVLRYWSELTEDQIARTLGLSRGTVKSTASRALDALEGKLRKRAEADR